MNSCIKGKGGEHEVTHLWEAEGFEAKRGCHTLGATKTGTLTPIILSKGSRGILKLNAASAETLTCGLRNQLPIAHQEKYLRSSTAGTAKTGFLSVRRPTPFF